MSAIQFVPILDADAETWDRVRDLRNSESVREFMYTDHLISADEHRAWLASLKGNRRQHVMVVQYQGRVIGLVSLNNISAVHQTADWAFYLEDEMQGRGIGGLVEYQLLELAFGEFQLEKLNCEVLETNPSLTMHERFGFVKEGVRRANVVKPEGRVNVHLLGILKAEWLETKLRVAKLVERIERVVGGPRP